MKHPDPKATAIDMQVYARKHWFDYFCDFDNPLIYKTVQFDVTELKKYCRENNLKFSLTMGFISRGPRTMLQSFDIVSMTMQ